MQILHFEDLGDTKVSSNECSLSVNLVIDIFCNLVIDVFCNLVIDNFVSNTIPTTNWAALG